MQPITHESYLPYDSNRAIWDGPHLLRRWFYFLTALLVVAWFTPGSFGLILCGALALYAIRGPRQSVEAIALLAFLILAGKTNISLGRWLVLFAAFGRTVWDGFFSSAPWPGLLGPLAVFSGTVFLFAFLGSWFPLVSILKLVTFTLGVTVAVTGFYRTRHLSDYWLSWLFTLGVFILLASIPLYGLEAGYTRNGAGFQGILTHPQTYGPVLASLTALLTGLYLFRNRKSWLILIGLTLGWLGMYASLSRTSVLAAVLALALTGAIGLFVKVKTWGEDVGRALGQPVVIGGFLIICGLAALQWTAIQNKLESFLMKDNDPGSVTQILEASRGSRISSSMGNFYENPIMGIGFGVPSDPVRFQNQLVRGPYGIPLSASVEKGFMPSAVLEETGVIGATLLIVFLIYLFAPVIQQPDPTLFWVMTVCLLINFGEMVFFSMGGMGFFFWIVMAFCHAASLQLNEERRRAPVSAPVSAGPVRPW